MGNHWFLAKIPQASGKTRKYLPWKEFTSGNNYFVGNNLRRGKMGNMRGNVEYFRSISWHNVKRLALWSKLGWAGVFSSFFNRNSVQRTEMSWLFLLQGRYYFMKPLNNNNNRHLHRQLLLTDSPIWKIQYLWRYVVILSLPLIPAVNQLKVFEMHDMDRSAKFHVSKAHFKGSFVNKQFVLFACVQR